jgi:transcriptional regulator with XRE-family HTH domain
MSERETFGRWLKQRRKWLDLTQHALAAQSGRTVDTIRKLEADKRRPSRQLVARLAETLQIPAADRAVFHQLARRRAYAGPRTPLQAPVDGPVDHVLQANGRQPVPLTPLIGREAAPRQTSRWAAVLAGRDDSVASRPCGQAAARLDHPVYRAPCLRPAKNTHPNRSVGRCGAGLRALDSMPSTASPAYDVAVTAHGHTVSLAAEKLPTNPVVGCSHDNSHKDPALQPLVLDDCVHQMLEGNRSLIGFMPESNLNFGKQAIPVDLSQLRYGVSVTDGCIDWATTGRMLLETRNTLKDVLPMRLSQPGAECVRASQDAFAGNSAGI